jgi:hypothetical protein
MTTGRKQLASASSASSFCQAARSTTPATLLTAPGLKKRNAECGCGEADTGALHVTEFGSYYWQRLRPNPEDAAAYVRLKRRFADQTRAYTRQRPASSGRSR